MKGRRLPEKLAGELELPPSLAGSVTVSGGRSALIEGHRGLLSYTEDQLVVSFGRQRLCLRGAELRLQAMNRDALLVTGRLSGAEWE